MGIHVMKYAQKKSIYVYEILITISPLLSARDTDDYILSILRSFSNIVSLIAPNKLLTTQRLSRKIGYYSKAKYLLFQFQATSEAALSIRRMLSNSDLKAQKKVLRWAVFKVVPQVQSLK